MWVETDDTNDVVVVLLLTISPDRIRTNSRQQVSTPKEE